MKTNRSSAARSDRQDHAPAGPKTCSSITDLWVRSLSSPICTTRQIATDPRAFLPKEPSPCGSGMDVSGEREGQRQIDVRHCHHQPDVPPRPR